MGYFRGDNNNRSSVGRSFGGNRSYGAKRSFGGNRGGGHPQMHDAICDNCGKPCQLPFKPTGDKPVYCRDCFAKMGGGEKRFERNDAPRLAFKKFDGQREAASSKADLDALNAKLDKILALLSANAPKVTSEVAAGVKPVVVENAGEVEEAVPVEKKKRTSKKAEVAAE